MLRRERDKVVQERDAAHTEHRSITGEVQCLREELERVRAELNGLRHDSGVALSDTCERACSQDKSEENDRVWFHQDTGAQSQERLSELSVLSPNASGRGTRQQSVSDGANASPSGAQQGPDSVVYLGTVDEKEHPETRDSISRGPLRMRSRLAVGPSAGDIASVNGTYAGFQSARHARQRTPRLKG